MSPAATTERTPAQILRDAADYMAEHGKCEGEFEDPQGRVCAIGAFSKVSSLSTYDDEDCHDHRIQFDDPAARQALHQLLSILPWKSITAWSDDNSAETVISTIRLVADQLERE